MGRGRIGDQLPFVVALDRRIEKNVSATLFTNAEEATHADNGCASIASGVTIDP